MAPTWRSKTAAAQVPRHGFPCPSLPRTRYRFATQMARATFMECASGGETVRTS